MSREHTRKGKVLLGERQERSREVPGALKTKEGTTKRKEGAAIRKVGGRSDYKEGRSD